jgi:hypothetical protein
MNSATPRPLTLEEHRELGLEIRAASARLRELSRLVASVYGPNNRAAFSFLKVTEAMDRLLSDLETQALQDLPGSPAASFYR